MPQFMHRVSMQTMLVKLSLRFTSYQRLIMSATMYLSLYEQVGNVCELKFLFFSFQRITIICIVSEFCYHNLSQQNFKANKKRFRKNIENCFELTVNIPEQNSITLVPLLLSLARFSPVFLFYAPCKRQKTKSFLTFSGGLQMEHWAKLD